MRQKCKFSKSFLCFLFIICMVLLCLIIMGFIGFFGCKKKVVDDRVDGGNIVLKYASEFDGIRISKAIPTSDIVGVERAEEGDFLDFAVDTTINEAAGIDYEVSVAKDKKTCNISDDDIRVYLEKEISGTYTSVFGPESLVPLKRKTKLNSKVGSMVIYSVNKTKTSTDNYRLRVWLSDKSLVVDNYCEIVVFVNGKAK